jgi:hypothetical protein
VNARVDRFKESNSLYVTIQIVPANVTLEQANDVWKGHLSLAFIQNNAVGRQLNGVRDEIRLQLNKPDYIAALRTGFLYRKQIPIGADATTLKVGVVDKPTGITGTVTVPLSRVAELEPQPEQQTQATPR